MVGQDAKSGQFTYYVCDTRLKKGVGSCPSHNLNSDRFESAVIDKIKEHVLTTENLTKLVKMVNEEMDTLSVDYRERLEGITKETIDMDRRLERLYDAIETGKVQIADLAPRIKQLRLRHDQLQANRLELKTRLSDRKVELADFKTISMYVADLRNLLSESELVEKKSFVRSFVKRTSRFCVLNMMVGLRTLSPHQRLKHFLT